MSRRMLSGKGFFHSAGGGGYTGPGDIVSGAFFWGGARAYSAAYAASVGAAYDIVDSGGANAATINVTTAGDLDVSALTTWIGLHGTAFISREYDQTGNSNHIDQPTQANRPQLTPSVISGKPCAVFDGSSSYIWSSTYGATHNQPVYLSAVYKRTFTSNFSAILLDANNTSGMLTPNFADFAGGYCGTLASAAATDGVFHAVQMFANSAASSLYVDGTLTGSLDFSTRPIPTAGNRIAKGVDTSARWHSGPIAEGGIWDGDQTSHNAALDANQRAYWGF